MSGKNNLSISFEIMRVNEHLKDIFIISEQQTIKN